MILQLTVGYFVENIDLDIKILYICKSKIKLTQKWRKQNADTYRKAKFLSIVCLIFVCIKFFC